MSAKKQREQESSKAKRYAGTFDGLEKPGNKKAGLGSLCFGSIVAPADTGQDITVQRDKEETSLGFFLEILLPFLFAGFGMVGAGILFDSAQSWDFFQKLPEAVILVPALLGLKGNLEMTLGSRLSTQANLGKMDSRQDQMRLTCSNLSLVQAQAVFISLAAAAFTVGYEGFKNQTWKGESYALLCLTSVATASITSLILGLIMIAVVLLSLRISVNPDNITTPIAASLGDMTTLFCMICVGSLLLRLESSFMLTSAILLIWVLFAILCVWIASKDKNAADVLKYGWYAIVIAMLISSGAGMILQRAVAIFPCIAPFQPVINGVGGNLVAIQASRISTYLHKTYQPTILPKGTLRNCLNPIRAFLSKDTDARASRVLLLMVVPGHLIFIGLIFSVVPSMLASVSFVIAYLIVAVVQVVLLLYLCQFMVPAMWRFRIDPDNSAIPILTAVGDLLGIALLFTALFCHGHFAVDLYGPEDDSFINFLSNTTEPIDTFQIE